MSIRIDGTNTTANPGITGGDADTGLQFGTDEIQFVTGGTNRATVENNGNFTIENGNLVLASGGGIDFSATADGSGTMTSELLDDYEEGTWTPTWSVGNATSAYGIYTKVGNIVHVGAGIEGIDANSSTDQIQIQGLPYSVDPSITNSGQVGNCYYRRISTPDPDATHLVPYIGSTGVYFLAPQFNSSNWIVIGYDDITTTGSTSCIVRFSISYQTA